MITVEGGIMKKILCKKCGISSSHPGITIGADNLCSICSGQNMAEAVKINRNSIKDYMEFLEWQNTQGGSYDCLLMYSGGKDSTYLLYKYLGRKKLIAFTFNNPFESKTAVENMEEARKKLHFEHISYAPDINMFYKVMKAAFLNQKAWTEKGKAAEKTPCTVCTLLMVMSACIFAYRMQIPYVIYGADPKQIDGGLRGGIKAAVHFLYDMAGQEIIDEFFGQEILNEMLDEDNHKVPKIIYPYIMEEKYEPEKLMEILSELGVYKGTPETTHCSMYPLLCYYSYKKYGCNFYAHEIAQAVRSGYLKREQAIAIDKDYKKIFLEILNKDEVGTEEQEWIKEALKEKYRVFAEAPNRKDSIEEIEGLAEYETSLIMKTYEVAKTIGITLHEEL